MKIMVFLHGTSIMHKGAVRANREERVRQVKEEEKSVKDYCDYVPVGKAVEKTKDWESQGATIMYLSSHETKDDINCDKKVLKKYGFPRGEVFYRERGEDYGNVVKRAMPDVLIEDDCESIGGEIEVTYPNLDPELKVKVKSVVVKEFSGIDDLPSNLTELIN